LYDGWLSLLAIECRHGRSPLAKQVSNFLVAKATASSFFSLDAKNQRRRKDGPFVFWQESLSLTAEPRKMYWAMMAYASPVAVSAPSTETTAPKWASPASLLFSLLLLPVEVRPTNHG